MHPQGEDRRGEDRALPEGSLPPAKGTRWGSGFALWSRGCLDRLDGIGSPAERGGFWSPSTPEGVRGARRRCLAVLRGWGWALEAGSPGGLLGSNANEQGLGCHWCEAEPAAASAPCRESPSTNRSSEIVHRGMQPRAAPVLHGEGLGGVLEGGAVEAHAEQVY